MSIHRAKLVVDASAIDLLPDGSLPAEFRIFRAGLNKTRKGDYLFDAQAATDVMGAYQAHAVDGMIDLEHLSLNPESKSFDPDARGWCRFELRDGELWATSVKWTSDGAARLSDKRQRYISPVFDFDTETRRISEIHNLALTAMPATDDPQALMAASKRVAMADAPPPKSEDGDKPPSLDALAAVLGLPADATIFDLIAAVKKIQQAGEPDGDEVSDEDLRAMSDAPPPGSPPAPPPKPGDKKAGTAMRRALAALTGERSIGGAFTSIRRYRDAYLSLATSRAQLEADKALMSAGKRHELVTEMVTLGAELPANAWTSHLDEATKITTYTPAEPWLSMPLDRLESRVAVLRAAKPAPAHAAPPPASAPTVAASFTLTDAQLKSCARLGVDPSKYLESVARLAPEQRLKLVGSDKK